MQKTLITYFQKTLVPNNGFSKVGNSFLYSDARDTIFVQVTATHLIICHDGDGVVQNMSMEFLHDCTQYATDFDFEKTFLNKYLQDVLHHF